MRKSFMKLDKIKAGREARRYEALGNKVRSKAARAKWFAYASAYYFIEASLGAMNPEQTKIPAKSRRKKKPAQGAVIV
jgi:hypothetical protein